jgi:hypothetical protein
MCKTMLLRGIVGNEVSLVRHLQETAWTRYTPSWTERGISRVSFNIVTTDIDAFVPSLHELENSVGKSRCPGSVRLRRRLHWGETAPFECPLQIREEVDVAGRQVATVGGVVQTLPTEGGNMVDLYCCRVGWGNHRDDALRYCRMSWTSLWADAWSITTSVATLSMLAGHALFRCFVFNTALRRHCLRDEVVRPTTNEEGCPWTQSTVTSHQLYAVSENKIGKLIFRLPYVWNQ